MAQSISKMVATWDRALKYIQSQINDRGVFENFFEGTYIESINPNEVVVRTSTKFASEILETRFMPLVREALGDEISDRAVIRFVYGGDDGAKNEITSQKPTFFSDCYLNPNFTFRNFVVGSSNREAYQAALLIASDPGAVFNPLLIYGDSGLGKTHLLHAIGNAVREKNRDLKVLYMTTQDFLDEYVRYIHGDQKGESLRSFFKRSVDVLLVDDIQFLTNKQGTEEMFFTVFQTLYTSGKQIVITSDQHPSKLKGLDERLRSRFSQGLPMYVGKPTKEMCDAIIRSRLIGAGMDVSNFDPEVFNYFSTRFSKNVRELDGAINLLIFHVQHLGKQNHVGLAEAIDAVRSLVDASSDEKAMSVERIISVVADYYKQPADLLVGKGRNAQIALARHVAMYLCRVSLDAPYKKIGDALGGRDHTTVMNGIQNVEKMLTDDPSAKAIIDDLKARIAPKEEK